jgi:hypothetical protein
MLQPAPKMTSIPPFPGAPSAGMGPDGKPFYIIPSGPGGPGTDGMIRDAKGNIIGKGALPGGPGGVAMQLAVESGKGSGDDRSPGGVTDLSPGPKGVMQGEEKYY